MFCCNYRTSTLLLLAILINGAVPCLSAQDVSPSDPPSPVNNEDQEPAPVNLNTVISIPQPGPVTAEANAASVIIIETTPDIERSEVIRQVVEALEKNGQAKRGEVNPAGKPIGYSATMFVRRDTPYQKAKQLVEALKSLSMNQLKFSAVGNGEFEQNSVIVQCPADATWRRVRTITDTLEKLGDFHVDVRVASNNDPVTATIASPFEPRSTTQGASPANGQDSVAPPKPAIRSPFERDDHTTADSQQPPVTVFYLKYADASTVARTLQQLGQQNVVVEERLNALLIRGDKKQLEEIEQLLQILDTDNSPTQNSIADGQGSQQPSKSRPGGFGGGGPPFGNGRKSKSSPGDSPVFVDVAVPMESGSLTNDEIFSFSIGILRNAETDLRDRQHLLDQKSRELAIRLRGPLPDPATGEQLKRELQNTVSEAFEARQELQRAELAEFARRLKGIQESIETRDRISEQIIRRRIEELLDPSLKWDETPPNRGGAQALRSEAAEEQTTASLDSSRRVASESLVNSTVISGNDGVIGKSPQEFNDLLAHETGACEAVEANLSHWEKARSEGKGGDMADAQIQTLQQELSEHKRKLTFAVQEYLEQIKLLEAVLQRDRARLAQADEAIQQIKALRKESLSTVTEVGERELQQQEARVALQRSESLLKLYQQAGEGFVPSSDESPSTSRENRWEVRYPHDPKQFGRVLDFFGVELGSADVGTKEITYLSGLSAGEFAVRRDLAARESRLFLTKADSESTLLARTYLDQAGIETQGRLVMWFYSDETALQLATLESKHAADKPIELVEKTVFGVRPKADEFEFYVISQSEKPTILNDAEIEAASERGAAASASMNPKLAEICSRAHAALMSIETLQYRFEKKDDQGWQSHAEFYADHIRFRVNRKDLTGIMGLDDDLKPIRNPPMTISSAFDGQKQQYARQNEPLRVKYGREGGSYGITIPQVWAYGWLRDGAAEFHWDTILSKERWEQRFQDAICIGDVAEDGRRFEIVDFPQRLEQVTPCIYRVYFARDLAFLPLKIFRNTLNRNEPSTTVHVTRFKTLTVNGKQIAIPLELEHWETQADGVSHKGETTITVDESSLRVNYPLDDSLFTLNDVNEPSTAIE